MTKLFGEKERGLEHLAHTLVKAAHLNAVGSYTPLLERFPFLGGTDLEHWDFIVTVAGVFIAATRLNNLDIGSEREDLLMEIVATDLARWKRDGIRGFEDCKALFEREYDRLEALGHEPAFVASDALGIWIVWNVLERQPQTNEEVGLVRAVGAMVTHAFFNWWKS